MLNKRELTIEEQILEKMNVILYRLDKIEEKIDQLNDPYNLNDYFRAQNNKLPNGDSTTKMPEGYTLVDTSGKSDTSRTFGAIIDG